MWPEPEVNNVPEWPLTTSHMEGSAFVLGNSTLDFVLPLTIDCLIYWPPPRWRAFLYSFVLSSSLGGSSIPFREAEPVSCRKAVRRANDRYRVYPFVNHAEYR